MNFLRIMIAQMIVIAFVSVLIQGLINKSKMGNYENAQFAKISKYWVHKLRFLICPNIISNKACQFETIQFCTNIKHCIWTLQLIWKENIRSSHVIISWCLRNSWSNQSQLGLEYCWINWFWNCQKYIAFLSYFGIVWLCPRHASYSHL